VRRLTATALAGICVLGAACDSNKSSAPPSAKSGSGPSTSSTPAPPVAVGALDGLLLSPDQVNSAMGASGMIVTETAIKMFDDTDRISDKNCLVAFNGELPVYAGSGWTATRERYMQQPGDKFTEEVDQSVVLFPAATDAAAFFTTSTKQWQSCADRQFTFTPAGQSPVTYSVGAVSKTNGTLNVHRTEEGGNGWNCQRALTVRNNVAVDVTACAYRQGDFAITVAHKIADNVPNK